MSDSKTGEEKEVVMTELLTTTRKIDTALSTHINDFAMYKEEFRATASKVENIHTFATKLEKYGENLNSLPNILTVLGEIKKDLIAPATGKNQMPVSIAFFVIAILGALLVFDRVKDTSKNIKINPTDGLTITESTTVIKKNEEHAKP